MNETPDLSGAFSLCPKCENKNPEIANYCDQCGTLLKNEPKKLASADIKSRINVITDSAAKWLFGIPQNVPFAENKEDRPKQINWSIAKKRFGLIFGVLVLISLPTACNKTDAESAAVQMLTDSLRNPRSLDIESKKVIWSGKNKEGKRAYIVKVEYSALNGFGNRIPGCIHSAFWFDEGNKFSWKTNFNLMQCDHNVGNFMGVRVSESEFIERTIEANNFVN